MYVKMTAGSGVASFIFEKENRSTAKERINYQKKGKVINMKTKKYKVVYVDIYIQQQICGKLLLYICIL